MRFLQSVDISEDLFARCVRKRARERMSISERSRSSGRFIRYAPGRGRTRQSTKKRRKRIELVIRVALLTSSARGESDHIAFVINRFSGFPRSSPLCSPLCLVRFITNFLKCRYPRTYVLPHVVTCRCGY